MALAQQLGVVDWMFNLCFVQPLFPSKDKGLSFNDRTCKISKR